MAAAEPAWKDRGGQIRLKHDNRVTMASANTPPQGPRSTEPVRHNTTLEDFERSAGIDESARVFGLPVADGLRAGPSHAGQLTRALHAADRVDALIPEEPLDKPPPAGPLPFIGHEHLTVMSAINAFGALLQVLVALLGVKWMRDREVARLVDEMIAAGLIAASRGRTHQRGRGPRYLHLTDRGYRVLKSRYRTLGVQDDDITAPPEKIASGLRQAPVVSRVARHDQHVAAITLLIRQAMRGSFTGDWHTPLWPHGRFEPPPQFERAVPRHRYRRAELRDMPSISGLRYVPAGDESQLFMTLRKISPDAGLRLELETEPGGSLIESDLLIEYQQDNSASKIQDKLLAYEALLTGWYFMLERFEERSSRPVVFWVCRTRDDARSAAKTADRVLAGGLLREHAMTSRPRLQCPARHQIIFADETEVLAGDFVGWKLPSWPPGHPHRDLQADWTRVRLFRTEP